MNSILLAVIFLFIMFLICYKGKISFKTISTDYLSYEKTTTIKGICAIFVFLHHFANEAIYTGPLFFVFKPIGAYMVALFFFYSGYGLMYSKKNKPNYMNNFLKQRFCSILIPYLIVVIIYSVVKYFYADISILDIFTSYFKRWPIADNSWFIVSILMLYFLFWLSFGVIKNWIPFAVVFTILFFWAIFDYNFIYWSYPIITFPLGMLWANYKTKIDDFIFKHYGVSLIITTLLTAIFFVGEKFVEIRLVSIMLSVMSMVFFTLLCMLVLMKLTLKNALLDFVSSYSFEIYMLHGLYIFLFRENKFFTTNSGIYLLVITVLIMLSSILLNKINSSVLKHTIRKKPKNYSEKNNN